MPPPPKLPLPLEALSAISTGTANRARLVTDTANLLTNLLTQPNPDDAPRKNGGGSLPGKAPNVQRGHIDAHEQLWSDYFADPPKYNDYLFRRRFRMGRRLFLRIVEGVTEADNYFVQKADATGRLGLTALQKCTAAIRMLAYGGPADREDENLRLAQSTTLKSLEKFCNAVDLAFGEEYLREPTAEDTKRLLTDAESRGFPGMLGSVDCMHWTWKNCPKGYQGQYQGRQGHPTIILEAVASRDLWIWHAFFGLPGSLNDINVLDRSQLFTRLAKGQAPPCDYKVNGNDYTMGYYLADGIYPKWATLVQTMSHPQGEKKKNFAKYQEAFRKDVERCFGVLQARFAIIAGPARAWHTDTLKSIMRACVIMHNMIVEDEREGGLIEPEAIRPRPDFWRERVAFPDYLAAQAAIRDQNAHFQLQSDLIDHLWDFHGNQVII